MHKVRLGRLFGLEIAALPSVWIGSALLWIALAAVGWAALHLPLPAAILGGLLGVALHWLADLLHQFGHAAAARSTGYPMTGITGWWVLSSARYPKDEPELPAATHLRRAFGGPVGSTIVTIVAAGVAALLWPLGGLAFYLAALFFLDNLLVFVLGAFLPLGFTDGSTILHYLRK